MSVFENWCALRNLAPFPTQPAVVANFVSDCAILGIGKVWPEIVEISRAHTDAGLADPTAGGWTQAAINELSKIDPPRSWPKEMKERFGALPWDVREFIAEHEAKRDKEVRRAHSEAARARQELKEKTNGTEPNPAAATAA